MPLPDDLLRMVRPRRGHFRLESGLHGDVWLDLDGLFSRPRAMRPFLAELAARLSACRIDAVCGPLTGGAFVAQMAAEELDVEFYFADRIAGPPASYRIPKNLRSQLDGKRVAVVDDAIYAGSAVRATIADLKACGAVVAAIGALVILGDSASQLVAEMQVPLEWNSRVDAGLWERVQCPMCRANAPLHDSSR